MRELRTCDFCGADAVGVFEVLPPELTPADDQRRVVLCDHCQATLTDVIEPLLTRLGVDADVDVPEDAAAETGASATTTGSEATGGAASVDVSSVEPAPSPPEPADHDSPDADGPADPLDDAPEEADGGSEAETDAANTGGLPDDAGTDGTDDVETDEADDAETDSTDDAETDSTDDGDADSAGDAETDDTPSEPPQFRKVVRILQNREFPVERASVEALASNAYDLDDQQVTEIFDYAVERGLLVDDGGTLRKP